MACKIEEVINDIENLSKKGGFKAMKAELEGIVAELRAQRDSEEAGLKTVADDKKAKQQAKLDKMNEADKEVYSELLNTPTGANPQYVNSMINFLKAISPAAIKEVRSILNNRMEMMAGSYDYARNEIKLLKNPSPKDVAIGIKNSMQEAVVRAQKLEFLTDELYEKLNSKEAFKIYDIMAGDVIKELEGLKGKQTLLHELVHANTQKFMLDNKEHKATKRVQELYKMVNDNRNVIDAMMTDSGGIDSYWSTSIDEFIAEGLSNPKFMAALMNTPVKGMERLSVFGELIGAITDMLGFKDKNRENMYTLLLDSTMAMTKEQTTGIVFDTATDILKSETSVGPIAYMSKEAEARDKRVSQNRQLAKKMVEERADKVKDKAAWNKYASNIQKGKYGYDRYSDALKSTIEKLVNPKMVPEVVGLMLSEIHKDKVVVGDYNYKTHTIRIAKEPDSKEVQDAAETALVQMYLDTNGSRLNIDELSKFVGENKAKVIERIVSTVEEVKGSHVLTHEMIHAGSVRFMEENPEHQAVKRIEELYQEAMSKKEEIQSLVNHGDIISTKWQEDKFEFVAEALSNPGLMNALNQVQTVGKEKLSKGLLQELMSNLLDMLGLDKKVKDNLLEFTMDGFAAMIEAQTDGSKLVDRELVNSLKEQISQSDYKIRNTYQFGETYHKANKAANKYVADLSGAIYDDASGWAGPKLKNWHNKQMIKSPMYKKMYNTIKDGAGNIELIDKLAQTLFLTGDTDRLKIAKLTKLVEDSNRPAMEILTSEMPEWDKKVSKAVPGEKEQRLLTEIYGLSGYGAMLDYYIDGKNVMQLLNEGVKPEELKAKLKLSTSEAGIAKDLYNRLVNHQVQTTQVVNAGMNNKVASAVALEALIANNGAGYKLHQKMAAKHSEIHKHLVTMAINAYKINNLVNKGIGSLSVGNTSDYMYTDYEGHGLLDIYSNSHEFNVVTERERQDAKYTGKMTPWIELKAPTKNGPGIMMRKSQEVYEQGLGVNMDRIQNGLYIDAAMVKEGIEKDPNWLVNNNVQEYTTANGYKKYRMILTKEQAVKAEGLNNVVQSLYRSVVHNTQLVEQQTMRKMIKAEMTEDGSTMVKLKLLDKRIGLNKKRSRKNRVEVKPYLKTDMSVKAMKEAGLDNIINEYKLATGVSQYEGLNNELRFVRRGLSDMMTGFESGSMFKDTMPVLQDLERKYKQLVVLKKLKMVVANPTKLMSDIISNASILMALDVDPQEGGKDMKQAFDYWNETSGLEAEIVKVKMELISAEASGDKNKIAVVKAKKDAYEKRMQAHPFYDAYKYGFVQSMATSMMIKEFDTVSGLQHTIDEVVKKVTLDDKHKPNEIHNAIVKFMHWGYSTEDALRYASNSSKINGTMFGDELVAMADRLSDHKKAGEENVPAYISEIIAGPQSELVRQGSRVMQMGDLAARWALYKHTIKELMEKELNRQITPEELNDITRGNRVGLTHAKIESIKEEAAMRSLDTFVDYRLNMPSEIKKASDLGILWFPSYWLRNTVVIPQIIAAKPLNSMIAIALSGMTGMATVYESHPLWKLASDNKSLVHPGMNVATVDTFIPWMP